MVSCLRAGEGVGKRSPERSEVLYGIQHSSHRGCAGLGSSLGLGLVMQCWTEALLNGMTECLRCAPSCELGCRRGAALLFCSLQAPAPVHV